MVPHINLRIFCVDTMCVNKRVVAVLKYKTFRAKVIFLISSLFTKKINYFLRVSFLKFFF